MISALRLVVVMPLIGLVLASCGQKQGPSLVPETAAAEGSARSAESKGLVGPGASKGEQLKVEDVGPPGATLLFLSGLKGYTEPCGCTIDLVLGGIDRITGFATTLAAQTKSTAVVAAGDFLFERERLEEADREQELRKADLLMEAATVMGLRATALGSRDLAAGVDFFLGKMKSAKVEVLAANVTLASGAPVGPPYLLLTVGAERIALIGVTPPASVEAVTEIKAGPAKAGIEASLQALKRLPAAEAPTAVAVLFSGDIVAARQQLDGLAGVDFVIIGKDPRETDESEQLGSAVTLEAYDQGRSLGRLKLVGNGSGPWKNARVGSEAERKRLDQIIATTEGQLASLPKPAAGQAEPPIVKALRGKLDGYVAERKRLGGAAPAFVATERNYLFEPVAMKPGYPCEPKVSEEMVLYNEELKAINLRKVEEIPPVAEGSASYVGVVECQKCHTTEHAFWKTTQHGHAIDTLRERNKEFDRSCIGCHVTGYREPGGSVLGNLRGLENVQCEQCHGPGSNHIKNPSLVNVPGGVHREVTETTCQTCHVPEHSPKFDFDTYLPRVLGPGHGR